MYAHVHTNRHRRWGEEEERRRREREEKLDMKTNMPVQREYNRKTIRELLPPRQGYVKILHY